MCMYMCVYVCTREYEHVCICVHVCVCTCVNVYMCVYVHVTCVYVYMCVYIHVCMCTCVCLYTAPERDPRRRWGACHVGDTPSAESEMCTYMYVQLCVVVYVCVSVCTSICVCVHVYVCTRHQKKNPRWRRRVRHVQDRRSVELKELRACPPRGFPCVAQYLSQHLHIINQTRHTYECVHSHV